MKRLLTILLGFLITFQIVSAQEQNTEVKNRLNLKIMPLSLVDNMPRARFGLEYISKSKWGIGVDVGLGSAETYVRPFGDYKWGDGYSFYEVRPEIKYLYVNKKHFTFYSALEIFYMQMNATMTNGEYQKREAEIMTYYDQADLTKRKYGFHAKVGINLIAGPFNFDFYTGMGFSKRKIDYSNVVNAAQGEYYFNEWGWFNNHLYEQNRTILHFALGFKIGYTLIKH